MTHICVIKLTVIGSDNGLSPERRQAIIWTNAGILFIGPLGTNFNEILIKIHTFSFKKMPLKTSSAKRRPFCLGLNVLIQGGLGTCWRIPINISVVWYCIYKPVSYVTINTMMPRMHTISCIPFWDHISGLMQNRCNSIANSLEIRLFCTNPLAWDSDILKGLPSGGHYWSYYPVTLSSLSSHWNSFDDQVLKDKIDETLNFKWVAVTWLNDRVPGKKSV